MQNQYPRVSEIKEAVDAREVNRLLKEGWIILNVSFLGNGPFHFAYVLGMEDSFDYEAFDTVEYRERLRLRHEDAEEYHKHVRDRIKARNSNKRGGQVMSALIAGSILAALISVIVAIVWAEMNRNKALKSLTEHDEALDRARAKIKELEKSAEPKPKTEPSTFTDGFDNPRLLVFPQSDGSVIVGLREVWGDNVLLSKEDCARLAELLVNPAGYYASHQEHCSLEVTFPTPDSP